ncbi:MAG: tetratricopeptide repeat protein [Treponema sp.]|jgi:tetratricopeptide (TPR) repeat protein|nr:tetratricopeptide repeat protein [Treponema sp.]
MVIVSQESVKQMDYAGTEQTVRNTLTGDTNNRGAALALIHTLIAANKLDSATIEVSKLLANYPQDKAVITAAARVYCVQGRLQEALGILIDAIDFDQIDADLYYRVGNIHNRLNHPKLALMAYAKAIELDPQYIPAYNNLGIVYCSGYAYHKAFDMFKTGLTLEPGNPILLFNYGVALERAQNLEEASVQYQAAVNAGPDWIPPLNNGGLVFYKRKQYARAIETFKQILNIAPHNANALNNIGVVFADQGDIRQATQYYRQALSFDARCISAVFNLVQILEHNGDNEKAIMELEAILELVPDHIEGRIRLAILCLKEEHYDEALGQAQEVLTMDDKNVRALIIAGIAQQGLCHLVEAQKFFEKVLIIEPKRNKVYLNLADLNFKRKKYRVAEQELNNYLKINPEDRNVKLLLAKLYAEMWNLALSMQIFEELYETDSSEVEVLAALVKLYTDTANTDGLSKLGEKAKGIDINLFKDMWNRNFTLLSPLDNTPLPLTLAYEDMIMMTDDVGSVSEQPLILEGKFDTPTGEKSTEDNFMSENFEEEIPLPVSPTVHPITASVTSNSYKIAGLLHYLLELSNDLPVDAQKLLAESGYQQNIESIIKTLEYHKGLLKSIDYVTPSPSV